MIEGFSPNVKKDRKRFGLRKKKSNKGSSVDLSYSNRDEHNSQVCTSTRQFCVNLDIINVLKLCNLKNNLFT